MVTSVRRTLRSWSVCWMNRSFLGLSGMSLMMLTMSSRSSWNIYVKKSISYQWLDTTLSFDQTLASRPATESSAKQLPSSMQSVSVLCPRLGAMVMSSSSPSSSSGSSSSSLSSASFYKTYYISFNFYFSSCPSSPPTAVLDPEGRCCLLSSGAWVRS